MSDVPFLMLVFQIKASVHEGKNVQSLIFNATFISKLLFFGYSYFYSKLVEKEMHLYKIYPKERTSYLQLLYKALMTIKTTSVEAKRAFSAMGFSVTKLRNRMSDKSLDALITIRQHYKKPQKNL